MTVGINLAGRPDPNNYIVGRGHVLFGPHDTSSKPSNGYIDFGNCPAFSLTQEQQDLDHFSSRAGLKVVDRNVLISEKGTLAMTLDEFNFGNIARWLAGTTGTRSGYNGAACLTGDNGVNTQTPLQGRWYDLVKTVTGPPSTNPFDDRLYDLGVVTVTTTPATVENTDFVIDYKMGRIIFITATPITAFAIVVAANASADTSYDEARMFTQTPQRGSLKFIMANPSNNDQLYEWEWHKVQLKPTGALNLIGDDWGTMEFTGTAEKNTAQSTTSPFCTVRTYTKAQGLVAD